MVYYNLQHLVQEDSQEVWGPIQDDEALFLYSIIRCKRISRILEIGGLSGYSAKNFLEALKFPGNNGILYTCDINEVPKQSDNHKILTKDGRDLTIDDIDNKPIDMIFFDCHDMVQMDIYHRLLNSNIINDKTIIALHDTNLHFTQFHPDAKFIPSENGYVGCGWVERVMVNQFKDLGYDIFNIFTDASNHSIDFPFRHGITVCQKNKKLLV